MSVVWRPPRKLLPFLVLFLCMVSALVVVAQQEEIPAAAPVQSSAVDDTGMTEITADSVEEQPAVAPAVDETQPVAQVAEPVNQMLILQIAIRRPVKKGYTLSLTYHQGSFIITSL